MREIEVKILDIDPVKLVQKAMKLGAEKVDAGLVKIKAYDFPDKRLLKEGKYVRVRKIAGRVEMVFKDPVPSDKYKVHEETEVTVSDFDTACTLLENLGMACFRQTEKYRATYSIGEAKLEIDKYPGIPWYVEVEATEGKVVENFVGRLGFDFDDESKVTPKTLQELYDLSEKNCNFKQIGESPDYDNIFK